MEETTDSPSAAQPSAAARSAALAGFDPVPALAAELSLPPAGVAAVVALLEAGNTVPFIARYRKEQTGNLDEVQIRAIEERRQYLVELEERRRAIVASIQEQGKLTDELGAKLAAATSKAELEDLYAPYRPRRKTRASMAREKGLEPLAQRILAQPAEGDLEAEAAALVDAERGVATAEDAVAGARDIVAELVADTAQVRAGVRKLYSEEGELLSEVMPGKADEPTKFEQYYGFREAVRTIPSHRFLAIRRGESEGVLRATVVVDPTRVGMAIERVIRVEPASPFAGVLREAIADAQKRLLGPSVENDVRAELKQRSDVAAVDIFAGNLRNLMLSAPLGGHAVIGIDPGLRTGCKCAAVDLTGKFLATVTIYLTQGEAQLLRAKDDLIAFVTKFPPAAIAVGNGTGGREAESFVRKVLAEAGKPAPVVAVNEAGASVYSASDLAREEFPELDLTIRGAISIARRLQDPLAELVKIEPKAIGVGQYQHDVHQPLLTKKLGDVVESCVNHVGVELNTASAQLLQYVAGIGKSLAKKIVAHRDTNGGFRSRAQLLDVGGLGPRAFEQAAGFLRIRGGEQPLDASAVHPERYALVEKMASDAGVPVGELVGNQQLVDTIDLSKYVDPSVGELTLKDIAAELAKPGRDPRDELSPPKFREDVTTMEDLKPGMVLEGVVTNVTAFGAFVDIGVHNDGLVHVSQLSDKFVSAPSEVVKVGQKLTVRVIEIDSARRRIALSARSQQERGQQGGGGGGGRRGQQQQQGGGGGGGEQRADGGGGGGRNRGRNDGRDGRNDGRGGGGGAGGNGGGGRGQQRPPYHQPQGAAPQQSGEGQPGQPGQGEGQGQGGEGQQQVQGQGGEGQQQGQRPPREGGGRSRGGRGRGRGPRPMDAGGGAAGAASGEGHGAGGGEGAGPGDGGAEAGGGVTAEGAAPADGGAGGGANAGGAGAPGFESRGPRGPRRDDANRSGGPGGPGGGRGPGGGGEYRGGPRRDDRGPGQGGPGGGGDFRGGPGGPGGQGGDFRGGPRRDDRGPRREDDRGPRRDEAPRRDEGPGIGIGGFVNNPFANLNLPRNKR